MDTTPAPRQPQLRVALLHINRAADELGLTPYQVRKLIQDGRLPAEKVGTRTYIPVAAIARYIASISETTDNNVESA